MTEDQVKATAEGEGSPGNKDEGFSSLPLRRSVRSRKRPSNYSEDADADTDADADQQHGQLVAPPSPTDTRRSTKRRVAPETFDVPENLLEASLAPWEDDEQDEWAGWVELESDPVSAASLFIRFGLAER
jgi:ubiquitin carboxyl-terminal hydrolase L5